MPTEVYYPEAKLELLSEAHSQPFITPTQIIWHTAVDSVKANDLHGYYESSTDLESHGFQNWDGLIREYMPLNRRADANRRANLRPDGTGAISLETEDDGDPEGKPWTEEQIGSSIRFGHYCCTTFRIPRRPCRTPSDPGLGYHSMWGAPSDWTPYAGKTCPGHTRIAQFPRIVAGIIAAEHVAPIIQGDPMAKSILIQAGPKGAKRGGVYLATEGDRTAVHLRSPAAIDAAKFFGAEDHLLDDGTPFLQQLGAVEAIEA